MNKSNWQIGAEKSGLSPQPMKLRIIKENKNSQFKVGDIVEVERWGTFGCWDKENRWVDFYSCEEI